MSAIGDWLALLAVRVTVRFISAGKLAASRAEAADLVAEHDGDGVRFGRKFLALLDAEIRRRTREADFWGSP